MESQERQRLVDAVLEVIDNDFHTDFEEIFEYTVRLTGGVLPAQPNNDIRNVLNHLANALAADNIADGIAQVERARRHLRFATRDCLAIAVQYRQSYLIDYVDQVERDCRGINLELRSRLNGIRKDCQKIPLPLTIRRESTAGIVADINALSAINRTFEKLLADCNEFAEYLEDQFPTSKPLKSAFAIRLHGVQIWIVQHFWAFFACLALGVVAIVILALFVAHKLNFFVAHNVLWSPGMS